jgi:hypothetical protein
MTQALMLAPAPVTHLHPAAPNFDADAEAVLLETPLVVAFRRFKFALEDRRTDRTELRVLFQLMEKINYTSGTAVVDRSWLADKLGVEKRVLENALYNLRRFGYIDWERRVDAELHPGRRLTHYVLPVTRITEDNLAQALKQFSRALAQKAKSSAIENSEKRSKRENDGNSTPYTVQKSTPDTVQSKIETTPHRVQTTPYAVQKSTPYAVDRDLNNITCNNKEETTPDTVQFTNTRHGKPSRLPEDWQPSAEDREFALKLGLNDRQVLILADGFRDYWLGPKAKHGGLKVDWPRTWRERVRNYVLHKAEKDAPNGSTKKPGGRRR